MGLQSLSCMSSRKFWICFGALSLISYSDFSAAVPVCFQTGSCSVVSHSVRSSRLRVARKLALEHETGKSSVDLKRRALCVPCVRMKRRALRGCTSSRERPIERLYDFPIFVRHLGRLSVLYKFGSGIHDSCKCRRRFWDVEGRL